MPAQLNDSDTIVAEFHINSVLSVVSPVPTIDVIAPDGTFLVTGVNMSEQTSAKRYTYLFTYPATSGLYQFRINCAASGVDDPDQRVVVQVGQGWIQNIDATIESRSTLTAVGVWQYIISNGKSAEQIVRGLVAVLLGKLSGANTTQIKMRNIADDTDVVVATVDSNGNRTSIVLDLDE